MTSHHAVAPRGKHLRGLIQIIAVICFIIVGSGGLSFADDDFIDQNEVETPHTMPIDPAEILDVLKAGANTKLKLGERVDAFRYAAKFPYQQVVTAIFAALDSEFDRAKDLKTPKQKEDFFYFVRNMVQALGEVATRHNIDTFEDILQRISEVSQFYSGDDLEEMAATVEDAREEIEYRLHVLPPLPQISNRDPDKEKSLQENLDGFKIELAEYVKGQPTAVEKLTKMRRRDLIMGFRENPSFMWFLGPPGTGKDTAVRGYLSAIHHTRDAYKSHLYRVDPIRTDGDLWSFLGSATGFVGSSEFPPVLRFLIAHSGGRYILEEIEGLGEKVSYRVVENSAWRQGDVLPGYTSPDRGVVYFDEFHDWAMTYKNAVAKKAVEYEGYWKINNPNGGLSEIYVPINIIAASNDALELVTSREKNGERFGRPLSYKEMKQKADAVRNKPLALRSSILRGNGAANSVRDSHAKGTSEELLNRVREDYLVLFDPLSPDHLREIAESKLKDLRKNIAKSKKGYSGINLTWTPEVLAFLQEYHYVAEDQARPIEFKVQSLVEDTIFEAIERNLLKPNEKVNVLLDVEKNSDNTWQMKFSVRGLEKSTSQEELFDLPIVRTNEDKARMPISDERIDELAQMPHRLESSIVGQKHALKKIARSIILSEEGRHGIRSASEAKERARTFMLLGPTSTGKTETSKVLAEILFETRLAAYTIDCTALQTVEAVQRKFLGHKDAGGNAIASDFMKHFDRNNGHMVVVLDELANVRDKEVLNALFDILREPVVSTFSDGLERIMSNVIIMITGNASQEILAELPKDLPEDVLREAWADIYDQLEADPHLRRAVLEKYFTPPFIARVGDDRIFFYKPLGYGDVRELVQMKFESLMKDLNPKDGRRGWDVNVPSEEEYIKVMEALETHGFKVKEQGASIDHYVHEVFGKELRAQLLLNKVKNGEAVSLRFEGTSEVNGRSQTPRHQVNFSLTTASGEILKFHVDGKPIEKTPDRLKRDQLITSAHEAGHAVVGLGLLSDFHVPTQVRILPGVTRIGEDWIYYAGLASNEQEVRTGLTREYLIREIAVLMGGTVAENLVIQGGLEGAGRSNDIERATQLAKTAILKLGMSSAFGKVVTDEHHLSDREKDLLRSEITALIQEGEDLAKKTIQANKELFVHLTNDLALSGELNRDEIKNIVEHNGLVRDYDTSFSKRADKNAPLFNQKTVKDRPGLKYEFVKSLGLIAEEEVADIREIVRKRKKEELAEVMVPEKASIAGRKPQGEVSDCAKLLGGK